MRYYGHVAVPVKKRQFVSVNHDIQSTNFRVIDTRHEQAAAHMADGWARTTGFLELRLTPRGRA